MPFTFLRCLSLVFLPRWIWTLLLRIETLRQVWGGEEGLDSVLTQGTQSWKHSPQTCNFGECPGMLDYSGNEASHVWCPQSILLQVAWCKFKPTHLEWVRRPAELPSAQPLAWSPTVPHLSPPASTRLAFTLASYFPEQMSSLTELPSRVLPSQRPPSLHLLCWDLHAPGQGHPPSLLLLIFWHFLSETRIETYQMLFLPQWNDCTIFSFFSSKG